MGKAMFRAYRYRLLPTKGQHARLREALEHSRQLYNAALEERIGAYQKTGKTLTHYGQSAGLTVMRRDPEFAIFPWGLQNWALAQVDRAYKAFFRRVKSGEKPGFPRFRSAHRFNTFGVTHASGWAVDGRRLRLKGVGRVALILHRPLPAKPKVFSISRDPHGWYVSFLCEIEAAPLSTSESQVGVDLGILAFAALSSGETIPSPRAARRAARKMRVRQRALARCMRGSKGRRLARAAVARGHKKVGCIRRTFHHQLAARLIQDYGLIAIENLNIKGLARGLTARDVNDQGWAQFVGFLSDKAEYAGRTLVRVAPNYTSQTCPECGVIARKELSERTHRCDCGCVLDRDVAAARVILHKAIAGLGALNLEAA